MKTIPPPCPTPDAGPRYWRSLDELADTPEFRQWVEREFPAGASELTDPVTRRSFRQVHVRLVPAGGFGLDRVAAGRWRTFIHFPRCRRVTCMAWRNFFATAMPTRRTAIPLLAKSNDGRPTKLEGNPQHPDSNGGTDHYTQASILNLYDPDRAIRFVRGWHGQAPNVRWTT